MSGVRRKYAITLHLSATRGLPTTQAQNGSALQIFGFPPSRRSIRAAHNGFALLSASHGSTLLARSAETPGSRTTVTRADRKTGRAKPGGIFGGAWNSWPPRRACSVTSDRFVSSCNGKAPARSSRAARKRYRPTSAQSAFSTRRPSLPAFVGLFFVKANLTGVLYHPSLKLSRRERLYFDGKIRCARRKPPFKNFYPGSQI